MPDKKYAKPIQISLNPSRIFVTVVVIVHIGAAGILALSILPWFVKIALLSVIVFSLQMFLEIYGHVSFVQFARNLFPQLKNAVWENNDKWLLETSEGKKLSAELRHYCFVHPGLTVVNLRLLNKPWYNRNRSLIFLSDNIDAETFRRLRVRLRWYSTPDQDSSLVLK